MAMHDLTIKVDESTYRQLAESAQECGHANVESFVASLIQLDNGLTDDSFDSFFTPERRQAIKEASVQISEGRVLTVAEMDTRHEQYRRDWQSKFSE